MKSLPVMLAASALLLLPACVAPVGPVEVTRFHQPDIADLGRGVVTIEPAAGQDAASLEFRSHAAAVSRELQRIGYAEGTAGQPAGALIAQVSIERETFRRDSAGNPVSVGIGGGSGGYGSGVGLGIGINLSGPPPETVQTRLGVTLRDPRDRTVAMGRTRDVFGPREFTSRADPARRREACGGAVQGFPRPHRDRRCWSHERD